MLKMRDVFEGVRRKKLIDHYMIRNSAHNPKPDKMLEKLIRNGTIAIERQRRKPPRIVWLKHV